MITISASEFSKNFGLYRAKAQREPIAVTSHNRVSGYFVSAEDYDLYQRYQKYLPKAYAIQELDPSIIRELMQTEMDSRHNPLDRLMDNSQ